MNLVIAWACAGLLVAAALAGWLAVRGVERGPVVRSRSRSRTPRANLARVGGALLVGAAVVVVTRWPALAVAAGAVAVVLPTVVARRRADAAQAARLEATRDWLLQLRSLLLAGEALEQAMAATAAMQPDGGVLAGPLRRMVLRLERTSTVDALRRLADDLDNHVADAAVVTLVHAVTHGSRELTATLAALGEWAREEVALLGRVEAERQGVRSSQTIILSVFAIMPVTFWVTSRDQLAVFATPGGQLVLSLILLSAAGCVTWMSSLLRPHRPARFLDVGGAR